MSREKQIEEMAKVLCEDCARDPSPCVLTETARMCESVKEQAEALYNAGYRKQSEGEWEKFEGERFICSNCARVFGLGSMATIHDVKRGWKYCPHCGAKMKGGTK